VLIALQMSVQLASTRSCQNELSTTRGRHLCERAVCHGRLHELRGVCLLCSCCSHLDVDDDRTLTDLLVKSSPAAYNQAAPIT
jgi:hypothetical protein